MDYELIAAADLSGWLDVNWWWSIIQTVLGIGLIIFVHELGHFLAAKSCGVKCEKFYVGFDAFDLHLGVIKIPRKLFHFQWGETEYGLGILPLGGYVKMLGQHDNPAEAEAERERAQSEEGGLDPRSYMAKSVIQRMFIISAGVIMNLIFAVIFAAIAFRSGVTYDPPTIGGTVAGSPAWENDLAGAEIVSFNGSDTRNRYYPFMFLVESIATSGGDDGVDLEIQRHGTEGQTEKLKIKPVVGLVKGLGLPMMGVRPSQSCRLAKEDFQVAGGPAESAAFQGGDVVTHINGNPVYSLLDMRIELAKAPDQPAVFTVRRDTDISVQSADDPGIDKQGSEVDVTVPAAPKRVFQGVVMEHGPIQAVQLGSPAFQEGIQPKDKLLLVDGQPFDPLTLSAEMNLAAREQRKVKLTIRRFEGEEEVRKVITLTPRIAHNATQPLEGLPLAIDELGIAFPVLNRVANAPEAQKLAIFEGDEIVAASMDFKDEKRKAEFLKIADRLPEWDAEYVKENWPLIVESVLMEPTAFLNITVKRGENTPKLELVPVESDKYFRLTRGIRTEPRKRTYHASTWTYAAQDAGRQVVFDGTKIFKILQKLVSGNVPLTALGGIGTIAVQAQSEASNGTSRLLLFLTLLSVNLAVLNFLPIPVLDGGHMMFLAWEGVTGRPPNERVQEGLTMVGAVLMLSLMVFAFGMDIWRFLNFM